MTALPTLNNLLQIIADRNLRVANLFQYQLPDSSWRWQSNLTDGIQAWEFGRGDTPEGALRAALAAITSTKPRPLRTQAPTKVLTDPPPPISDEEAAKIPF